MLLGRGDSRFGSDFLLVSAWSSTAPAPSDPWYLAPHAPEPLTTGGTRFLTFMLLSRRFLCLQRLSRLRSLEKPSSPLKAPLGRQSLQSSLTVYLLSTPKEELNHSHLCFPLVVLYKPTRALRLSWGTACRHFTSYISKRPISVFFEFPAITTVPGTRALTKCLLN